MGNPLITFLSENIDKKKKVFIYYYYFHYYSCLKTLYGTKRKKWTEMLKPFNYKGFRALMECHRLKNGVRQPDNNTNEEGL